MATQTDNDIYVQVGDNRYKLEGEELSNFLESAAQIEAEVEAKKNAEENAKIQKALILKKLGITEDEAKLILS